MLLLLLMSRTSLPGRKRRRRFPPASSLISAERERERREGGLCCPLRTCWKCVMYIRRLWAAAEKKKYLNHKSISARLDFNGSNAIPMIFSDTHRVDSLWLWLIWLVRTGHRRRCRCRYKPALRKAGVIYVAICMRYSCTFVAMPPSNEPRPLTTISCPLLLLLSLYHPSKTRRAFATRLSVWFGDSAPKAAAKKRAEQRPIAFRRLFNQVV